LTNKQRALVQAIIGHLKSGNNVIKESNERKSVMPLYDFLLSIDCDVCISESGGGWRSLFKRIKKEDDVIPDDIDPLLTLPDGPTSITREVARARATRELLGGTGEVSEEGDGTEHETASWFYQEWLEFRVRFLTFAKNIGGIAFFCFLPVVALGVVWIFAEPPQVVYERGSDMSAPFSAPSSSPPDLSQFADMADQFGGGEDDEISEWTEMEIPEPTELPTDEAGESVPEYVPPSPWPSRILAFMFGLAGILLITVTLEYLDSAGRIILAAIPFEPLLVVFVLSLCVVFFSLRTGWGVFEPPPPLPSGSEMGLPKVDLPCGTESDSYDSLLCHSRARPPVEQSEAGNNSQAAANTLGGMFNPGGGSGDAAPPEPLEMPAVNLPCGDGANAFQSLLCHSHQKQERDAAQARQQERDSRAAAEPDPFMNMDGPGGESEETAEDGSEEGDGPGAESGALSTTTGGGMASMGTTTTGQSPVETDTRREMNPMATTSGVQEVEGPPPVAEESERLSIPQVTLPCGGREQSFGNLLCHVSLKEERRIEREHMASLPATMRGNDEERGGDRGGISYREDDEEDPVDLLPMELPSPVHLVCGAETSISSLLCHVRERSRWGSGTAFSLHQWVSSRPDQGIFTHFNAPEAQLYGTIVSHLIRSWTQMQPSIGTGGVWSRVPVVLLDGLFTSERSCHYIVNKPTRWIGQIAQVSIQSLTHLTLPAASAQGYQPVLLASHMFEDYSEILCEMRERSIYAGLDKLALDMEGLRRAAERRAQEEAERRRREMIQRVADRIAEENAPEEVVEEEPEVEPSRRPSIAGMRALMDSQSNWNGNIEYEDPEEPDDGSFAWRWIFIGLCFSSSTIVGYRRWEIKQRKKTLDDILGDMEGGEL
jgi:hypothetical protein